jgi:hypothetical protein
VSVREPGFYWVRFKRTIACMHEYDPEIAFWGGSWMLSANSTDSPRDDELEVLSERLVPPGDLEASAFEKATGALFRAAKAERVTVHLRLSWLRQPGARGWRCPECGDAACTGHPKQPGAKAAPTAAKSRAARTRR